MNYTYIKSGLLSVALVCSLASCDAWVNDATMPKNTLTREELNNPNLLYSIRSKALVDGSVGRSD